MARNNREICSDFKLQYLDDFKVKFYDLQNPIVTGLVRDPRSPLLSDFSIVYKNTSSENMKDVGRLARGQYVG